MGGPGSGRRKGGAKSSAMKSQQAKVQHFKYGGGSTNKKSPQQNYKKAVGKLRYMKKTGQ